MPKIKDSERGKMPIGIEPKNLFWGSRMSDLINTCHRYSDANLDIPIEWTEELAQINKILKEGE